MLDPPGSEGIEVSSSEHCFHSSQQLAGLLNIVNIVDDSLCALHALLLQHNIEPLRLNTIHSAYHCLETSSLQRVTISTTV